MKVITRFAPSPTGYLHIGNARTALYNLLYAKKHQGQLILRIEDTDENRSKKTYTTGIQKDLTWLGIKPDQTFIQSEQKQYYPSYYEKLIKEQHIYYCTCSKKRLNELKQTQIQNKRPPGYDGHCQDQHIQPKSDYALRFKVPKNTRIQLNNGARVYQFESRNLKDFVIERSDRTPVFLFSNVIDDYTMQVTHIIRGEDHLTNTPKQILILKALGHSSPNYTHLPLVINANGAPLSKRQDDIHIQSLRNLGYTAQAINNYLIRLGHQIDQNHLLSMDEMIQTFHLNKLSHSPAKFDIHQLNVWQKIQIQQMSKNALLKWALSSEIQYFKSPEHWLPMVQENITTFEDIQNWNHALFSKNFQFKQQQIQILQKAGRSFFDSLLTGLKNNQYQANHFESLLAFAKKHTNQKGKHLFLPIRIALTRENHGPSLTELLKLLDQSEIEKRLTDCLSILSI